MIGANYCEWVGKNADGTVIAKAYEQFTVREKRVADGTMVSSTPTPVATPMTPVTQVATGLYR